MAAWQALATRVARPRFDGPRLRWWWGLLSRLVGCLLVAAALPAAAQQLSVQRYGKADGLTNQNVLCLLQDRGGFLWACSENGLFRYDGNRFQRLADNEGLHDMLVYTALQDRKDRLWAVTASDLFVGEQGKFRAVRPDGRELRAAADTAITLLADGRVAVQLRGQLLALSTPDDGATWQAANVFSDAQRQAAPSLATIHGAHQARDGRLWVGCDQAICSLDADGVHVWDAAAGVPADRWMTFLLDSTGRLWARGQNTLVALPAGASAFEPLALPDLPLRGLLDSAPLAESADGSIVVRTDRGVARWWHGRWTVWSAANGLGASEVPALLFDHEGSLWLSASGQGLVRWLGYDRFEAWTTAQGLDSDVIWGLLRSAANNQLMVGTRGACVSIGGAGDNADGRVHSCGIDNLPPGAVGSIAQMADGSVLIGMHGGELMRVERGEHRATQIAKLPRFTAMLVDSQQRLWLPSRSGVYLMASRDATPQRLTDDAEYTDAVEDAAGGIWVAGSSGLQRFADGVWTRAPLDDARSHPGFVSVAISPDGRLWAAGRSSGLLSAELRDGALHNAAWVANPVVDNASIMFVRLDASKRLWVGTDFGVAVLDGGEWRRLTESDGLIWNDVDLSSFFADTDGSVWIGTSGGLTHILDPARALAQAPLRLEVLGVRFGDKAMPAQSGQQWPWSRTAALDLHLASFNFSRSADSVYRYRIAGIDADWFESRDPHVHYPALEPGSHRFEAMVVDRDSHRTSPTVSFDFTVLPPWWRTWWFQVSMIACGVLTLSLLWGFQVRRLTARHEAEQRQTRERSALMERASRDALTGLWNRAAILDLLTQAIAAKPADEPLALAVIDVDHFKRVNDTHGHAAGDAVLAGLSQRLAQHLRQVDQLGRYGGEELVLLLPGLPCGAPAPIVERLREAVAGQPFTYGEQQIPVTISIGVAWFGQGAGVGSGASGDDVADTAQLLFQRADASLYQAKRTGRNRVVCSLPTLPPQFSDQVLAPAAG